MQVQKRNSLIGAGLGAVAGGAAGVATGIKKAAPILAEAQKYTEQAIKDAYVNSRQNDALERLIGSGIKSNKFPSMLKKVAEKAAQDFPSVCKEKIEQGKEVFAGLVKKAKTTKNAWIAVGLAAGVAVGALIGKLASKKANKTEKA